MNPVEDGMWAIAIIALWKNDAFLRAEFESICDFYDLALAESRRLIESSFKEENNGSNQ